MIRYSSFSFLQDILSFLVNFSLSFPKFFKYFFIVYCTQTKNMDSLLQIPLFKLKMCLHFIHMILIKTFHLNHITLMINLLSLMIPQLLLNPFHMILFLPRSQTGTNHFIYLMSFMIFLQNTTNRFLGLMENTRTLQLRNIFNLLIISLTFLKQSMMMFV